MVGLSPRKQVRERIPTLTAHADEVRAIESGVSNEFGTWSALKLIILAATVNMYTTVISSNFDDWFYIDVLAGSGISDYDDSEETFLGSPLVAALNAADPFTKMYFIEADKRKAEALDKRLHFAFNDSSMNIEEPECGYSVLQGNSNSKVMEVVSDMWKIAKRDGDPSFNHLSFVDNQGLDFLWEGVEQLAPSPTGDFLVNFPTVSVNRARGNDETLTAFFGNEKWKQAKDAEELSRTYQRNLRAVEKTKQVVTHIDSGERNYHYDLIYATRETANDSGYREAVKFVKKFVEAVDGADVEEMLDILRGDQMTISSYLSEVDEDPQKRLGDF